VAARRGCAATHRAPSRARSSSCKRRAPRAPGDAGGSRDEGNCSRAGRPGRQALTPATRIRLTSEVRPAGRERSGPTSRHACRGAAGCGRHQGRTIARANLHSFSRAPRRRNITSPQTTVAKFLLAQAQAEAAIRRTQLARTHSQTVCSMKRARAARARTMGGRGPGSAKPRAAQDPSSGAVAAASCRAGMRRAGQQLCKREPMEPDTYVGAEVPPRSQPERHRWMGRPCSSWSNDGSSGSSPLSARNRWAFRTGGARCVRPHPKKCATSPDARRAAATSAPGAPACEAALKTFRTLPHAAGRRR